MVAVSMITQPAETQLQAQVGTSENTASPTMSPWMILGIAALAIYFMARR